MKTLGISRRDLLRLATVSLLTAGIGTLSQKAIAASADWPTKTVKLVVPFPPGGGTDLLARALAERLSNVFGRTFVVENRPGAGAAVGTEYVARATDGHTFLFASSNHVTVPALNTRLRYDIFKDFKSISLVTDQASVFAVSPDLPGANLGEVLEHIKANPGKYNYGTAGIGSGQHLSTAYLQQLTGIDVVHVPLKGQGEIISELLGKRIQLGFLVLSTALPYFQAGTIRPLGVSTEQRSVFAPDIPTISEAGVPNFVARSWLGLLGPVSTPDDVVTRLHDAVIAFKDDPSYIAITNKAGMTLINSTPEELDVEIKRGYDQWRAVVAKANIQQQ